MPVVGQPIIMILKIKSDDIQLKRSLVNIGIRTSHAKQKRDNAEKSKSMRKIIVVILRLLTTFFGLFTRVWTVLKSHFYFLFIVMPRNRQRKKSQNSTDSGGHKNKSTSQNNSSTKEQNGHAITANKSTQKYDFSKNSF